MCLFIVSRADLEAPRIVEAERYLVGQDGCLDFVDDAGSVATFANGYWKAVAKPPSCAPKTEEELYRWLKEYRWEP